MERFLKKKSCPFCYFVDTIFQKNDAKKTLFFSFFLDAHIVSINWIKKTNILKILTKKNKYCIDKLKNMKNVMFLTKKHKIFVFAQHIVKWKNYSLSGGKVVLCLWEITKKTSRVMRKTTNGYKMSYARQIKKRTKKSDLMVPFFFRFWVKNTKTGLKLLNGV